MKTTQNGFAAIEGLLILVILAIIGGTGWYVWHSKQEADKTLTNVQTGSSTPAKSSSTPTTTPTQSPQKYLTIKEWGVRVKLDDSTSDAYYLMKDSVPNAAYLSLTSLKGTGCAADNTSLGVYSRFSPDSVDPDHDNQLLVTEHPDAVRIGNYYYYAQTPQANCDGGQMTQAELGAAVTAFHDDIKSISAIPAQ